MANNYYDMTGVLNLSKVTPVIKALFSVFELNKIPAGNGQAYIADIAESSNCSWDSVLENLQELAKELRVKLESNPAETVAEVLSALSVHFDAGKNEELNLLIERSNFEDDADLYALFTIAKAFDDGHGLKGYKTEASWHCDQPRLFEFGGCGDFTGSHVSVGGSSDQIVQLGEEIEAALATDNTDAAAGAIQNKLDSLLAGIYDDNARAQVRNKLSQLLSA